MTSPRPQSLDPGLAANRCYSLLLAVSVVCGLTSTPVLAQEIRYKVELKTRATAQTLAVEVTGLGFARRDSLVAYLPDWGDWTELGRPYLQNVTVRGRRVAPASAGTIPLGTGPFVLRYELPLLADSSTEARRFSLLPRSASGTVVAAVRNTLVEIRHGSERVAARTSIRLVAPSNVGTFTGWSGFARGSQSASVLPVGASENGYGFYAFGVRDPATRIADGVRIEVVSTGDKARRVPDVLDLAARTLPLLQKLTGAQPDTVVRLFVRGSGLPGVSRGTATQFGISISLPPDDDWNEWSRSTVTHELSHLWIGGRFLDERLLWFMEGFNDYLALWVATAAGVVSPEWFAQRLTVIADDLAALPPASPIPLTTRGAVGRDRDGPQELQAYRGGALAAFMFDVSLRAGNKGTLGAFVGRLLARPEAMLSEDAIHSTADALGIATEFHAAVGASRVVSPWAALHSVGYVITADPATLVALGIAAEAVGRPAHLTMGPAVVRAIDPSGPAAAADIAPGDTVTILSNERRSFPPNHDASVTAATLGEYIFGSSVVPSHVRTVTLEVRRSGTARTFAVTPRLVAGGLRLNAVWDTSKVSTFFEP